MPRSTSLSELNGKGFPAAGNLFAVIALATTDRGGGRHYVTLLTDDSNVTQSHARGV